MFAPEFNYLRASSVAEAGQLLTQHPGAKVLAGGHSLIPLLKLRLAAPEVVIDIGRIPELRGIDVRTPDNATYMYFECCKGERTG